LDLISDERRILYSVQVPNVPVPSTHAVLAGGGAVPPPPPPQALSSANAAPSNSSFNFVRCRIICFTSLVLPIDQLLLQWSTNIFPREKIDAAIIGLAWRFHCGAARIATQPHEEPHANESTEAVMALQWL